MDIGAACRFRLLSKAENKAVSTRSTRAMNKACLLSMWLYNEGFWITTALAS